MVFHMTMMSFRRLYILLCFQFGAACPANWLSFSSSCYSFIDTPVTWTQASATCQALHSELVTIDDASEHAFLNRSLRTISAKELASNTLVSYWTSGNDLVKENHWVWGNNEVMDYAAWGPGEPNNARGANCMALHSLESFRFNDDFCNTSNNRFICEISTTGVDPIVG